MGVCSLCSGQYCDKINFKLKQTTAAGSPVSLYLSRRFQTQWQTKKQHESEVIMEPTFMLILKPLHCATNIHIIMIR